MPEITTRSRKGTLTGPQLDDLEVSLRRAVAVHMHCEEDELYEFNPNDHIDYCDLTPERYNSTAVVMVTIITYGSPSRLANLSERLMAIRQQVLHDCSWLEDRREPVKQVVDLQSSNLQPMQDCINITFVPKSGWVAG